jgi:hypothetical protein
MSGLDELHQIERLAAFDLGRLDLLVVEQDIFVLDYLIAANDSSRSTGNHRAPPSHSGCACPWARGSGES